MNETIATNCRRCAAPLTGGVPGRLCAACFGGELFADEPARLPFSRIGDYELLEEIGRGGMGLVYRARQVSLNRPAAVKLILTGPLASAMERQRFVAEASAAAALDHPGIVSVYEAGEEDGQPFFAMQLIEGESLSARLGKVPRFSPREAAEFIRRVALAVQHAHERGFLHRDLKPGNILLDDKGAPHVTDFGLARRVDDESRLTLTGAAVGTPSYMAPEQTDTRQPPTTAVDVYSLGAILYEMLSGQPPFKEKSLPELFVAIREKEPASISSVRAEVDRDLDIICRICLEKQPARRYRSAQSFADDLQHWLSGEPISARAVGRPERLWRWCRRRPAIAALAAAALVFFLTGLTGILWQWRRANKEADSAVLALHKAKENLWRANFNEAHALRISRERGQRTRSLEAIRKAAAYRPSMELRNEAIAALALPDLGEPVFYPPMKTEARDAVCNSDLTQVAYSAGDEVQFQRLADGGSIGSFKTPDLRHFFVSPNHDFLAMVWGRDDADGGRTVTLWRVKDHTKIFELSPVARGMSFARDGRRLVLYHAGKLEVRETETGKVIAAGACPFVPLMIVADPACEKASLIRDSRAEIWTLTPPAFQQTLPDTPHSIDAIQWHPFDETLAAGAETEAWHFKPALNAARLLTRHDREGVFPLMHPSGLFIATIAWDSQLRFCHPALSDPLLQTSGLRPAGFSADGRALAVTVGEKPGLCAVTAPDVWRALPVRGDDESYLRGLDLSPDGKWLAVVSRNSLAVWDTETLHMAPPLALKGGTRGRFTGPRSMVISEDQKGLRPVTLTSAADGSITLTAGPALFPPPQKLDAFALSPDGSRALVHGAAHIVFDTRSGAELFRLAPQAYTDNPAWSPDGRWLATGYWNNKVSAGSDACVWSAIDGSLVKKLPAGNCAPFFTPDSGRLIISSTHESIEYEAGTWRELRRHPRAASGFDHGAVAFAPGAGLMALMADESVVQILSLRTGEELARLTQPFSPKISTAGLAMSPDGHWLACDGRNAVRLWNLTLFREKLRALGLDWAD